MDLKDIVKTRNIITISPDKTLASVLSQLSSSHDAAFMFSEEGEYIGVINPYHCLIKNSYPGNAKVEHCLFHAPRIKKNYSVLKVAQLLIESKIHYLPIFDDRNKFIGITSSRHILSLYRNSPIFNITIGEFFKRKSRPLVTIFETDLISTAINIFKSRKISKLVVLSKNMKLKGVLTYYDLISFLITPKRKGHKGDREGSRPSFQRQQIKNFVKSYVLTLTPSRTLKDALDLILEKEIGSVIVVDEEKTPIGIITTREFLSLLLREKPEGRVEISGKHLSEKSRHILGGFFHRLANMGKHLAGVQKIKLKVIEEKKGGVFETILSLIPQKGPIKVIKKQGKNLAKLLKKIRIKQD